MSPNALCLGLYMWTMESRYDPIVIGEFDRGGAINTLTPHKLTSKKAQGMVTNGFLVEVERANLDELRRQYPKHLIAPTIVPPG